MSRGLLGSGPITREGDGGGGGPKTIWVTHTRAWRQAVGHRLSQPRSFSASRDVSPSVKTTIFANEGSGSSGDMARKKRRTLSDIGGDAIRASGCSAS